MIRLERTNGEVLSRILREVSPIRYESIKKVNKLLDGTYHVQIIGQPLMSIEANIISSHNQAEELNQLIDQGTPLVLIFLDRKYLVYIDESSMVNPILKSLVINILRDTAVAVNSASSLSGSHTLVKSTV